MPWPGVCAQRARGCGPAGGCRRHSPAASAQAPWRGALPMCWPEGPSRWPADALAPVPRRPDETPSGTRAQRSIAWMAESRTRRRRVPRPGPVCHRDRVGAACGLAVGKRERASALRRSSSEVRRARATAMGWGPAGASKRSATPSRWVGSALVWPSSGRGYGRCVCWPWARSAAR